MIKWVFLTFVIVVVFGFTYFYRHLGLYKEPTLYPPQEFEFQFIAASHVGPYYKINSTIKEVESWAKNLGIPCDKTFGLYKDNPEIVEESRLRSEGGCLVYKKPDFPLPPQFHYKKIPKQEFLSLRFDGSPSVSPFVVYPKIEKWFQEHHLPNQGPTLEVYTLYQNSVITEYYSPTSETKH